MDSAVVQPLVTFCKALADENRLKIIGLLADKPYSVEELAATLGISSATVSHHLQRLQKAGLVQAHVLQYYNVYALNTDTLHRMAEQLASTDSFKKAAGSLDRDGYSKQVLADYIVHGRLKSIPSQVKKRHVVLRRLAEEFQAGKRYPEKRVDEILQAFHRDFVALRGGLVDLKLLAHEGGYYWRVTGDKPEAGQVPPIIH